MQASDERVLKAEMLRILRGAESIIKRYVKAVESIPEQADDDLDTMARAIMLATALDGHTSNLHNALSSSLSAAYAMGADNGVSQAQREVTKQWAQAVYNQGPWILDAKTRRDRCYWCGVLESLDTLLHLVAHKDGCLYRVAGEFLANYEEE